VSGNGECNIWIGMFSPTKRVITKIVFQNRWLGAYRNQRAYPIQDEDSLLRRNITMALCSFRAYF